MHRTQLLSKYLIIPCMLTSTLALAAWDLDNSKSALYFTSTKNHTIEEKSQFTQLAGHIDDNGQAKLTVSLNSVDTRVPIRDERMREILFQTLSFPQGVFTVNIDPAQMSALSDNQPHNITVDGTLDLHGVQHEIKTNIIAQELSDNTLQIKNAEPIVLNVNDYDMTAGVEELRTLAALQSIAPTVPINFTLVFNKTS